MNMHLDLGGRYAIAEVGCGSSTPELDLSFNS
jgi:hypothetical protein